MQRIKNEDNWYVTGTFNEWMTYEYPNKFSTGLLQKEGKGEDLGRHGWEEYKRSSERDLQLEESGSDQGGGVRRYKTG